MVPNDTFTTTGGGGVGAGLFGSLFSGGSGGGSGGAEELEKSSAKNKNKRMMVSVGDVVEVTRQATKRPRFGWA